MSKTAKKKSTGKKICAAGRRAADKAFGNKKWSAYKALWSSRYCKDPSFGRKSAKK